MGVSESYLILGSMYYDGTGVGKDYEYYNKACKMGEELGCKNVKTLLGD
ncbi:SEL1-like repeat protein [Helicobacter salomonis]|nr:SEL1-like repeat protein [Helicobacter salomonis]